MDVWRYSDWWGLGQEVRNSQRHIWHWRDWIVESVNADKGYDQMIREMLAADELYPNDLDRVRATGFLVRHYFRFNRSTWLDETIEHTSKAFLGLTLNCVKCHDHKYDPLEHKDYYRFRAFFEPYQVRTDMVPGEPSVAVDGIPRVFDCNLEEPTYLHIRGDDRNPQKDRPLTPGVPKIFKFATLDIQPVKLPVEAHTPGLRTFVLETHLKPIQKKIEAAQVALKSAKTPEARSAAEKSLASAEVLASALRARETAERAKRDTPEKWKPLAQKAAKLESEATLLTAEGDLVLAEAAVKAPGAKKAEVEKKLALAKAAVVKAKAAVANPGENYAPLPGAVKAPESPTETEANRLKPFPTVSTGRRTALAAWITDAKNPLTARVAVNHLWARHFGKPLVASVFDFGRKGATPTHPELLDYLAVELTEHQWSLKYIHRLMVTSQTYRLSSSNADSADNLKKDGDNRYLWRMNPIRMEAQAVRDALLHLAGDLDTKMGGPSIPVAQETNRRSLYYVHSNNDQQRFLNIFDDANVRECYRRSESIVPQQALALSNSKLALTMAAKINAALHKQLGEVDDAKFIEAAFATVLACAPTTEEVAECNAALKELNELATNKATARMRGRGLLIGALLNHNDFITVR